MVYIELFEAIKILNLNAIFMGGLGYWNEADVKPISISNDRALKNRPSAIKRENQKKPRGYF